MKSKKQSLYESFRDVILDSTEPQIDSTLRENEESIKKIVTEGRQAIKEAFNRYNKESNSNQESHQGMITLINLLMRKHKLTEKELSEKAKISEEEIRKIEFDPFFTPNPRTIYQLAIYFRLPQKSFAKLSGVIQNSSDEFKEGVLRFAAKSKMIGKLNKEEKKLLNEFIRFLDSQQ